MATSKQFYVRKEIEYKKRQALYSRRLASGGRWPIVERRVIFPVTHYVGEKNFYSSQLGTYTAQEFDQLRSSNGDAYFKIKNCITRPCLTAAERGIQP